MSGLFVTFLAFGVCQGAPTSGKLSFFDSLFKIPGSDLSGEPEVCFTEPCLYSAINLIASIDSSIDPCDDFYGFACNGWIERHPIPPTAISWNKFNDLSEKLDLRLKRLLSEGIKPEEEGMVRATKMIYEACMDEERIEEKGVEPLLELLQELNGWPLISPEAPEKEVDWEAVSVLVSKKVGITPVLSVGVDVDLRNTSRNVIIVEKAMSSVPSYFFTDPNFSHEYALFLTKNALILLGHRKFQSHSSNVRRKIRQIIQFEKSMTELTKKKDAMRVLEKSHNPVAIKELQAWTDKAITYSKTSPMNWKKYIQELLEKDDSEINEDTRLVVSDWNFLKELFQLIEVTQPETVVNYLLWEVVKTMGRSASLKMRNLEFKFQSKLSGIMKDIPRWQECVHATDDVTFAVGYLYVKKYFSDEAKAKAINMVENIRQEFRKELSEVNWIDEETKRSALEKADYMNHFIGYPNWYSNVTALDEFYDGLKIGRDHFANILAVRQFVAKKYLRKLNKITKRDEWVMGPALINAYYDPRLNSIAFPAGILEFPFFNKDQLDALNYGSIGSIIGHEITHAFDDFGRQGDKLGNINQWWTKETEETYLKKAQCFIEEYGKYEFTELESSNVQANLNGLLTLGENIADNGGLTTALRAYLEHSNTRHVRLPGLKHYSSDQLFYLGFATTWCETTSEASLLYEFMEGSHSPHNVRVLESVSNSEHFAETWGCPKGSKMNPHKKCRLW